MNKDLFRYLKFVGNFLYKTFNIINLPFLCAVYALKKLQQQRCQMNIIGIALKELAVGRKLATVHILQHVQMSKLETYFHNKRNFHRKPSYIKFE